LFHCTVYPLCSTVQFTHSVPLYSLPTLFHCTVYPLCSTVQFTHSVPLYSLPTLFHCTVYLQVEINFIIPLNEYDNAQEYIDFHFFALKNLIFHKRKVHHSFNICTTPLHRLSIDLLIVLNI